MDTREAVPASVHIADRIREVLQFIGEDPTRDGLIETPQRVAKAYEEMFSGLWQDPVEPLLKQFAEDVTNDYILIKDIQFFSVCEHHLLPFFGHAHIAYKPRDGVVSGLSKFARSVEIVSKRPQVQERMTDQIAKAVNSALEPHAVFVLVEAEHTCMSMRGIKKVGATTVTQKSWGFSDNEVRDILSQINK